MPALSNVETNSTILVTGANGFIATWLVGDLLKKGYNVRAAVRTEAKGKNLLENYGSYGDKLKIFAVGDIKKVCFTDFLLEIGPDLKLLGNSFRRGCKRRSGNHPYRVSRTCPRDFEGYASQGYVAYHPANSAI